MANPPRVPSPTTVQAPSVGRIVHYIAADTDVLLPWAAIVAAAGNDSVVTLHVFPPHTDARRVEEVPFSEEPKAGCWSWPPRV